MSRAHLGVAAAFELTDLHSKAKLTLKEYKKWAPSIRVLHTQEVEVDERKTKASLFVVRVNGRS